MSTILIDIRRAKPDDAVSLADTHDEAWRTAYMGLIPGPELEKLVQRRGPSWWDAAIRRGSRIALLTFGDEVAGYANFGRNRAKSLHYGGEIYELYLRWPSATCTSPARTASWSGPCPTTSRR